MSKKKLIIAALLIALIAAYFVFDLGRYLSLEYIKSQAGRLRCAVRRQAADGGGGLLRRLCRGDGAVAAGRRDHDAGCRRDFRPAGRHRDRLLRIEHRRDARVPRVTLRAARQRAAAFRVAAGRHQQGRREGRRVLSVHVAPRAADSVFRDQPGDGPHAHEGGDLLLGEPARHAGRHDRLRERRHAAREDRVAARHLVARADRLVRAARRVSADREEDRRDDQAAQGLCALGQHAGPRASIAT